LTDEVEENLVNVNSRLGGGFEELAREFTSEGLTLLGSDYSLIGKIALVSDQDHGDLVNVLDPQNLFSEGRDVVESRLSNNRISQKEALPVLHVQISHGSLNSKSERK
jgi:hypothetical protein